jgi:hypothetical protein
MSSCLAKLNKWHSMEIESKFIGPLYASQIWKHIHWAFRYIEGMNMYWTAHEHLWAQVNASELVLLTSWTPIKWAWMPMSEWEQLLNTHWGQMNTNEWVLNTHWLCMKATESLLNVTQHDVTMRKIGFVSELNTPWILVSVHEFLWVIIEHTLNACEYKWTPMSEYWTPP